MPLLILNYDEDDIGYTEYVVTEENGNLFALGRGMPSSARFRIPNDLDENEQLGLLRGYYEQVAKSGTDYLHRLPGSGSSPDQVRQAAQAALRTWSDAFHWHDRVLAQGRQGTIIMVEPGLHKALVRFDAPNDDRAEAWYPYDDLTRTKPT